MIKAKGGDRKVFFVFGGTETADREDIRRITELENDAIIVASYGTFSTGINIRNLHNIVFASPTKSRIRNLQSVGRGLRKGITNNRNYVYSNSGVKVESTNAEVSMLREKNEEYRKALNVFREKLNEVAIFNSNLAYATRLFTEHSTTKKEKININPSRGIINEFFPKKNPSAFSLFSFYFKALIISNYKKISVFLLFMNHWTT